MGQGQISGAQRSMLGARLCRVQRNSNNPHYLSKIFVCVSVISGCLQIIYDVRRATRTHPSFGKTTTQAIRDLLAWCRPTLLDDNHVMTSHIKCIGSITSQTVTKHTDFFPHLLQSCNHLVTSIAGLVHVNDLNLTTKILVFPCQPYSVYAMKQFGYTHYLYYTKLKPIFSEGQSN